MRAAIDIGSNSLLLTVVSDDGSVVHDEARVVGLGKGLGDRGVLLPDRMKAAEEVLAAYVATAGRHGVEPWAIRAVATSAARRAMNAETWLARLQKTLGLKVRIVSGDEEARLSWLGARRDLVIPEGDVLVIDVGGGSTEVVIGDANRLAAHASLEIGSVRLTEEFLGVGVVSPENLERLRSYVDAMVDRFAFEPPPREVVGVAGSVTTLATMVLDLTRYEADKVHGSRILRVDLDVLADRLLPCTPEQRRAIVPASPERADFLLAATAILARILDGAGADHLVVSDRGLRFGLLSY